MPELRDLVEAVGLDERAHHVGPDLARAAAGVLPGHREVEGEVGLTIGTLDLKELSQVREVVLTAEPLDVAQAVAPETVGAWRPRRPALVRLLGGVREEARGVDVAEEEVPGAIIGDHVLSAVRVLVDVLVMVCDACERLVVGEPLVLFAEPLGLGRVVARAVRLVATDVEGSEPFGRPAEVEHAPEDPVFEAVDVERVGGAFGVLDVGSEAVAESGGLFRRELVGERVGEAVTVLFVRLREGPEGDADGDGPVLVFCALRRAAGWVERRWVFQEAAVRLEGFGLLRCEGVCECLHLVVESRRRVVEMTAAPGEAGRTAGADSVAGEVAEPEG